MLFSKTATPLMDIAITADCRHYTGHYDLADSQPHEGHYSCMAFITASRFSPASFRHMIVQPPDMVAV